MGWLWPLPTTPFSGSSPASWAAALPRAPEQGEGLRSPALTLSQHHLRERSPCILHLVSETLHPPYPALGLLQLQQHEDQEAGDEETRGLGQGTPGSAVAPQGGPVSTAFPSVTTGTRL